MAFLDAFFRPQKLAYGAPWDQLTRAVVFGGDSSNVNPDTAMRVAAVYACVRVLSEDLAKLPRHVYERTASGKRLAPQHRLMRVLRRPNKWQTWFEFVEMMQGHLALRGNAYAEQVPGPDGAVMELWPLHPDRMKVEMLEDTTLRYTYRNPGGKDWTYTQQEMFHVRGLSSDGIIGMSPIAACRDAIGVAMDAERHEASTFKRGGKLGVVLQTKLPLKKDAAEALLKAWEDRHGGPDNANRTALLTHELTATTLGMSNEDAQFLELRKFQIAEIARIFRVPLHMIGDLERATFSNIEHQSLEYIRDTLSSWVVRWEQAISRDLLVESLGDDPDRYYVKFNVDAIARGDLDARSKFYREMVNSGIYSINDVRELEDMNPVPQGDEHLVNGTMITLDRAINPPEPQPAFGSSAEEPDDKPAEPMEAEQRYKAEAERLAAECERIADDKAASDLLAAQASMQAGMYRSQAETAQEEVKSLRASREEFIMRAAESAAERDILREQIGKLRTEMADAQARSELAEIENENHERCIGSALAAARVLADSTLTRLAEMERDGIEKAAGRDNFLGAVDTLYEKHAKRLADAMRGVLDVLFTLTGQQQDADSLAFAYCERQKNAMLELSGNVTAETLADSVDAWLDLQMGKMTTLEGFAHETGSN